MKKDFFKFLVLLIIAIGAGPASSQVYKWSLTAGPNGNADPHINFSEGMAPSAVNDSARAMMAGLAQYRDDISGALATGGISTAYTVTTNQGLCVAPASTTTPIDGQLISITVGVTNGAVPTLQTDSCSAFAIQSAASIAVPAGTLVSGSPYTLKFSNTNSAWMLRDFYSSSTYSIPLGGLLPSTSTTVPNSNFILPAGQCISTATYASYWVQQGSPASGGCAGGQFAVIDLRGRILAALDNLNGSAANRLTSASTGCGTAMTSVGAVCANGLEGFALTLAQLPTGIISSGTTTAGTSGIVGSNSGVANLAISTSGGGTNVPTSSSAFGNASPLTTTTTSNNTSGTAHPNIGPTIGVTYFLRVI